MNFPDDLKYTKDHEWVRIDTNIATVGITDYAQHSLGDIVYLELPNDSESFSKGDTIGVVESVKAVSDIFTPMSGEITEVNDPLKESPETMNEDCYGEGWLYRMQVNAIEELDELMDHTQYAAFVKEEQV
jgi:glycine cleavage system H protein